MKSVTNKNVVKRQNVKTNVNDENEDLLCQTIKKKNAACYTTESA